MREDGERRARKNRDARLTRLSALELALILGERENRATAGNAANARLQMMINAANLSAAKNYNSASVTHLDAADT